VGLSLCLDWGVQEKRERKSEGGKGWTKILLFRVEEAAERGRKRVGAQKSARHILSPEWHQRLSHTGRGAQGER